MWTKLRMIRTARETDADFLDHFRADRQPLRLYQSGARFDGTPLFRSVSRGLPRADFQMLGSPEVDETFPRAARETRRKFRPRKCAIVHLRDGARRRRNRAAPRIPDDHARDGGERRAVPRTARHGVGRDGHLRRCGGGRLGESRRDGARAFPRALITTVTGLLVAIPAMFGYNFLVTTSAP
jgi:biopolymer transport protein TolQ